jgi:hypothetical protein
MEQEKPVIGHEPVAKYPQRGDQQRVLLNPHEGFVIGWPEERAVPHCVESSSGAAGACRLRLSAQAFVRLRLTPA